MRRSYGLQRGHEEQVLRDVGTVQGFGQQRVRAQLHERALHVQHQVRGGRGFRGQRDLPTQGQSIDARVDIMKFFFTSFSFDIRFLTSFRPCNLRGWCNYAHYNFDTK